MRITPELQFAIHAVRQASSLVQQVQAELVTPALTKEDRSPVTVADYAAQAVVSRLLERTFPGQTLVAEEDADALRENPQGGTLRQVTDFVGRFESGATPADVCQWIDRGQAEPGERFWTLDPVDGTKGFLRGDQYAIALAHVDHGQVTVGVLGCPRLARPDRPQTGGPGSLVVAARGQGSWTTSLVDGNPDARLRVSDRAELADARLLRSFEASHTNPGMIDELIHRLGIVTPPVAMDSQAKYAVLAAGGGDLLLRLLSPSKPNYRERIWDQAAGSLVVEEAGGSITDLLGHPLDFSCGRNLARNRGILASNGRLQESVRLAIAPLVSA